VARGGGPRRAARPPTGTGLPVRRVLLHCVGSAGDVLPFIAIARALQARGAAPVVATSAWFAPLIERAGVAALSLGVPEDYAQALGHPDLWHPWRGPQALWSIVLGQLPATLHALEDWLDDPQTLLVGSTLALAVRVAAERGHPRTATVHLAPACLLSADRPARWPGWPPLHPLPRPLRTLALALARGTAHRLLAPPLEALRTGWGLPPLDTAVTTWMHSPHRVIAAFPDWYAPAASDWPAQTRQCGFPTAPAGGPLSADLEAFLQAGAPPVVITAGTGHARAERFLESGLRAALTIGLRAVLVCAFRDAVPPLPSTRAIAVAHAPFAELLPRAAAVIHHGGVGTTAAAFAAGVPQCISPLAYDQVDNAARVAALAAGLRLPAPGRRAAGWSRILRRAVSDPALLAGARTCAMRMSARPPAAEDIADRLLEEGTGGG